MDKKKILIVSRSFYPTNSPRAFRTTELAKEFARQGHEVTVFTPKDQIVHTEFEKLYGVTIKDLGTLSWQACEVKGSGLERLIRRTVLRFSTLLFEYPNIQLVGMVKKALKRESGYDLLISIAVPYPVHWGVASIRSSNNRIGKIWIADCGDPYMGAENDTFKHPFYFKYIEKWFSRKADYITVPTTGSINAYYPEFHDKIRVIPQGFRFEDVKVYEGDLKRDIPEFGYAGNFIPGRRDPKELLSFLNSLPDNFRFHIYTNRTDLAKPYADKSEGRIILHKVLPRPEVLYELSRMNFLVNFENAGHKQTPSKLIDYAILNKPVMSVTTGNLDKETVKEFLQGNYRKKYVIEDPNQYRIENVCKKFLSVASKAVM